jgi:formylglycine-generating enzyme required for sulfatase activity
MKNVSSLSCLLSLAFALIFLIPLRGAEPRVIPDLNLKLMPIPAGTFLMGSPPGEPTRMDWEGPQTRVTISHAFWLGATPVTQAQWKAIMGTSVAQQTQLADAKHRGLYNQGDDVPMYYIDWFEAVEFCHRLAEREHTAGRLPAGYEYRLPTEAEWEYACRAGTTTATYAGDLDIKGERNAPILDGIAWYGGNSSVGYTGPGRDTTEWKEKQYPGGIAGPHPVAQKKPNAWGLYDTIGNVACWCGDWYADKYPGGEVRDPKGPATGTFRTFRGGSWIGYVKWSRSAARFIAKPDFRDMDIGVRVALCPVRQSN